MWSWHEYVLLVCVIWSLILYCINVASARSVAERPQNLIADMDPEEIDRRPCGAKCSPYHYCEADMVISNYTAVVACKPCADVCLLYDLLEGFRIHNGTDCQQKCPEIYSSLMEKNSPTVTVLTQHTTTYERTVKIQPLNWKIQLILASIGFALTVLFMLGLKKVMEMLEVKYGIPYDPEKELMITEETGVATISTVAPHLQQHTDTPSQQQPAAMPSTSSSLYTTTDPATLENLTLKSVDMSSYGTSSN